MNRPPNALTDKLLSLHPDELLVIVGETASGKTNLALDIASRIGGVVVGADSVQVYRGFDIGSGKPSAEELGGIQHHLIDVAEPSDLFDAARFVELADSAIAKARASGSAPIVCGGTFLWVKALLHGLASAPRAPSQLRERLQRDVVEYGSPALHARLATVDTEAAARLHPNDATRIIRALEVFEFTGKPLSLWQREHGFRECRYNARMVAIAHPRSVIEERIGKRVDAMLAAGWIEEVRDLCEAGHGNTRAMQAVGYAQVKQFIDGAITQAELRDQIYRATRIFARRQRTWLAQAPVEWLAPVT